MVGRLTFSHLANGHVPVHGMRRYGASDGFHEEKLNAAFAIAVFH